MCSAYAPIKALDALDIVQRKVDVLEPLPSMQALDLRDEVVLEVDNLQIPAEVEEERMARTDVVQPGPISDRFKARRDMDVPGGGGLVHSLRSCDGRLPMVRCRVVRRSDGTSKETVRVITCNCKGKAMRPCCVRTLACAVCAPHTAASTLIASHRLAQERLPCLLTRALACSC